ncbi:hypothetical protein N7E81_15555 [Reichenbachiella carrageenanivorans]|uniref:Oxygen tolerance n=1 Tax=Reichenbachiella carrageenanivorans TaxID=2979869 RepID=A0ABY6CYG9_9BACT|nr:hypothetical protein [Reichenbachiella carrageenanivorans]UXX78774.1 hypothetical protein N7E81_15555 [Reichenbachiella carrageenanivorans]
MKPSGKGYMLWIVLAVVSSTTGIQAQRLWPQVQLSRTSTYIGQPVEVSITVYTSTWFTDGVDLGNIQVDNAYTVYFRPVSVSLTEGGKTYAGIQLIYHVFPADQKDIVFPSLSIEVETPADGDYVGVKHRLKTKERVIKVRPVPPGFDEADWLVATGMYVSDHWSGNVKQVKVGEVLERKVARTVYGTVAELIPPARWDSTGYVSMYPDRSLTQNNKGKTSISSSRTESMRYLFEKEGTVTIPEMVFTYFHPYQQKLYKRTLKAVTIDVQPNPDLGVLASVRDSLLVQQKQEIAAEEEDKPLLILGMTPEQLAVAILLLGVLFYFLTKVFVYLYRELKKKRQAYLESEAYYFDQFKKMLRSGNPEKSTNALYRWLDELALPEPSVRWFVLNFGNPELISLSQQVQEMSNKSVKHWARARRLYLSKKENAPLDTNHGWINP